MQSETMNLVQISDCHLLARPGERLGGWDNWAALEALLANLRRRRPAPDAILLSGDLVHDESAAGYRRLADWMGQFDVPVYAIPGNHDDPTVMAREMAGVRVGGCAQLGGWRLELLDSRIAGDEGGRVGAEQLTQVMQRIDRDTLAPVLLAVHHPPVSVASPWIDAIGLADGNELLAAAATRPQIRGIVSGHVHQAWRAHIDELQLLTCPAVTRQFLPRSRQPAEDNRRVPGFSWLRLGSDGRLSSRVHRVAAARWQGLGTRDSATRRAARRTPAKK